MLGPRTGPPTAEAPANAGPGRARLDSAPPATAPTSIQPLKSRLSPLPTSEVAAPGNPLRWGPQDCLMVDSLLSIYYILQPLANSLTLPRRRC